MRSTLDLSKEHNKKILKALSIIEQEFVDRAIFREDASNFKGSANRVARMFEELYWDRNKIASELEEALHTTFPVSPSSSGMIVHGPVLINSMCPHHFMPVRYEAYIGIIPQKGGVVLGTSKMDRIPDALSRRFVLQEQLAKDIVDAFYNPNYSEIFKILPRNSKFEYEADGAICTLIGIHTCEACRGVRQDARTMVTERRGTFEDNDLEARFFSQVSILEKSRPFGR